jgi:penicillin-binding protein 2
MDSTTLILIIAAAAFVITFVTLLVVLLVRGRRRKKLVVKQVFTRKAAPEGVGIGNVRKPELTEPREKGERHGRLYAFGLIAAGILGTLAMRLWSLQMISGDSYQQMATENMTSEASIPAMRGRILDRNGEELVGNRPSICVLAPKRVVENPLVVHMLSLVLGIPKGTVRKSLLDASVGPQANRVIATDVPMDVVAFIREHQQLFAGVEVTERTIRTYPHGSLAAHTLGYIGPVTDADLLLPNAIQTYEGGDYVGKSGAEYSFENVLQGIRGTRTYKVDVEGNPLALLSEAPPLNGSDVCLTLDVNLQKATDTIIDEVIKASHLKGFNYANAGALVCIDIEDGGILASSSFPSYDPAAFTDGISEELWAQLTADGSSFPLANRVISGQYPAASTFKAFVSLAGMEYGMIAGDTYHNCTGTFEEYGEAWGQNCWIYPNGHGWLGLEEAINQSCDIYFYSVAAAFYNRWTQESAETEGDLLQDHLRTWGFERETGVDIPGELAGRIPDAKWKKQWFFETPESGEWRAGDMTNMCIGQGDVLVSPLQIANGYAGIARRKMLKPHFLHSVLNSKGEVVVRAQAQESEVQPIINDGQIARVEDGLRRVVQRMGGKFNQLPVDVAGKSGTAEVFSAKADFSWFVAYAPASAPKYCVCSLIEQAGDGSSAALLAVQHTLGAIYDVDLGDIIVEQGSRER